MHTQQSTISTGSFQIHPYTENKRHNKSKPRVYSKGMGKAVADRTINRKITKKLKTPDIHFVEFDFRTDVSLNDEVKNYCDEKGFKEYSYKVVKKTTEQISVTILVFAIEMIEEWEDVAYRVALGNTLLHDWNQEVEFRKMRDHLEKASLLMSGRHLQHGDETQPSRNMEVFTNCATSASSFLLFYLLLNGSGVGRALDDQMMLVDYSFLPIIVPVIDGRHGDVLSGEISERLDLRSANHLYKDKKITIFEVPDSREGWAHAVEKMEVMAFSKTHRDEVLILDFSKVRPRGSAIGGMQNRPASGPGPLILAIEKMAKMRDAAMEPWRATMFVDHYLAECVLVGGARRAARMATKTWRDPSVLDFVNLKRGGFLWSSNNSVTVDEDFWSFVRDESNVSQEALHARSVFKAITEASYFDGTGEPGLINQDKLSQNKEGIEAYLDGKFAESKKYKIESETLELTKALAKAASELKYLQITNPCGEITLNLLGGYCVIADVVPYHADSDEDAIDAFKTATRALMRVNLMNSMYEKEVKRTNRIGVSITGFHEWAFKRFGYGFRDIINEDKTRDMWLLLSRFKREIVAEAKAYAQILGTTIPHTDTTIKPAGTTSKLFGLTEGAHLPSMREYLRWVQFRNDDPLVEHYRQRGYPLKVLKTYSGTTVVGFPTQPEICKLGMGDKLVTAAEATPEEQYQYLRLLEKYWIRGVADDGVTQLPESGNQISYTLKYNPEVVSYDEFVSTLLDGQSGVRCCSVMPMTDTSAYEYQPEEKMTTSRYNQVISEIQSDEEDTVEEVSMVHVDCQSGACPIDFKN